VKKFLKLLVGLSLLPLCWAASRTVFFLLQSSPSSASGWAGMALPLGFVCSVLGFFLLPQAFRTYVLGHELTHALWGMLFGAKVGKMKVGKEGGHVELSKSNVIISLAPYFFPFYTAVVIACWYGAGFFWNLRPYEAWWMALVGFTWGFHVVYTVFMLSQHQPDVQEHGRLFSYVCIYLVNLILVAVWMIALGEPTCMEAWERLSDESVAVYAATILLGLFLWDKVQALLSQTH
jgi:hypothetical protein